MERVACSPMPVSANAMSGSRSGRNCSTKRRAVANIDALSAGGVSSLEMRGTAMRLSSTAKP